MDKSQIKTTQKRIVIASLLKPIDDTRMYEKIGVSLVASGEYETWIIGYPATTTKVHPNIHFLASNPFNRLSWKRLIAPLEVFQKILQVKPELLIINTHELLIVAFVNRILFGTKIIYDIQENYYRNLMHTHAFPLIVREVFALGVRLKEKFTAIAFHGFLLAEKGYESEMSFFRKKYVVIENKSIVSKDFTRAPKDPKKIRLLFSGTLAESTGVFQAIELAKVLHQSDARIQLHIIGYSAQSTSFIKIKEAITAFDFIQLTGGDHLVPHHQIMKAIGESDFGIICYPTSPHTQNSIPTKLYEYLTCRLPILLQNHRPWIEMCLPVKAAIAVNFNQLNAGEILEQMKEDFYQGDPENVTWESESEKLLKFVKEVLSK